MKNHAPHHKDIADILGSVHDRDHYTVIRDFFELSAILEYRQTWFTPAYLMAWTHFKAQIGRGKYPNSATVPKLSEPPENAPEPPKQERTPELVPVMAETAHTMDANGQYSLF